MLIIYILTLYHFSFALLAFPCATQVEMECQQQKKMMKSNQMQAVHVGSNLHDIIHYFLGKSIAQTKPTPQKQKQKQKQTLLCFALFFCCMFFISFPPHHNIDVITCMFRFWQRAGTCNYSDDHDFFFLILMIMNS